MEQQGCNRRTSFGARNYFVRFALITRHDMTWHDSGTDFILNWIELSWTESSGIWWRWTERANNRTPKVKSSAKTNAAESAAAVGLILFVLVCIRAHVSKFSGQCPKLKTIACTGRIKAEIPQNQHGIWPALQCSPHMHVHGNKYGTHWKNRTNGWASSR